MVSLPLDNLIEILPSSDDKNKKKMKKVIGGKVFVGFRSRSFCVQDVAEIGMLDEKESNDFDLKC
jgi:hypothetical protein